jgi:hypothetical protein
VYLVCAALIKNISRRLQMKTRMLISILFYTVTVLIIVGSCATSKKVYVLKEDEKIFGTWINPDYDASWIYAKLVIKSDGVWEEYSLTYSDRPVYQGEYTITKKWTDSEGYVYYKSIITRIDKPSYRPYYILLKIDKTGKVYEDLWSTAQMPTEFDPDNKIYNYRIYSRQ